MSNKITVEIVQQPEMFERFRYRSEGRSTHLGTGIGTKTLASIRVLNYTGLVTVVVSCVHSEKPYRQHPNILVGDNCKKGVCTISYSTNELDPTVYKFQNVGIQCVKKADITEMLTERETCNVDPFKAGFAHKKDVARTFACRSALRLCFQVFVRTSENGTKPRPIHPIVSNIIRGRDNIEISDISDTTSPATGNKKIIIFCNKVLSGDIMIRFYREDENGIVQWEAWEKPITVFRQAAIVFRTPAYTKEDISQPVNVLLQLVRPSDGKRSEPPRPFRYDPDLLNAAILIKKKEPKITQSEPLFKYIERNQDENRNPAEVDLIAELNIPLVNPNVPPMNSNQPIRPPASHSNFVSNFPCHDQPPYIDHAAQSLPQQETHFENRVFSHNHTELRNVQSAYNVQYQQCEQPQINISQPAMQSQITNQPYHSYHQHNQYELQSQNIQPMSGVEMQSYNAAGYESYSQLHQQNIQPEFQPLGSNQIHPSHSQLHQQNIQSEFQPLNNSRQQQNELYNYYQQQQQQQYHSQSDFHQGPVNFGYGGKYLSTAASYYPNPSFHVTEQVYDPASSNQFCPTDDAPIAYHEQNLCENNFISEANNILNPLLI